jgi:aminoglycoside phosphotransferase (APT) family kinase protein
MGATVESVEALQGGLSSAMHRLRLRDTAQVRSVALRRYVRPEHVERDSGIAERESRTLSFVESLAVPTPMLLAVDLTGAKVGAPALLMTCLPGKVEWAPDDPDSWLRRMAEVLPTIHAATVPDPALFPAHDTGRPSSFEPPPWAHQRHVWERAVEIFHQPAPEEASTFIHGDFHPGNLLWHQARVTGVIDWQAGSIGSPSVDVANCHGNLMQYGLDFADRFTTYWEHVTGEQFNPWASLVGTIGYLDELRDDRPADWREVEEHLTRTVAELDDS